MISSNVLMLVYRMGPHFPDVPEEHRPSFPARSSVT
jgi:hypothetical protein